MSFALRIILIIVSFVTFFWVMKNIRKSKFKIEDSIFWIVFSALLLLLSLIPQIMVRISEFLGVLSASNFVFLVIIFVLIIKIFHMSVRISQLESKLQGLVQIYAIDHTAERSED